MGLVHSYRKTEIQGRLVVGNDKILVQEDDTDKMAVGRVDIRVPIKKKKNFLRPNVKNKAVGTDIGPVRITKNVQDGLEQV